MKDVGRTWKDHFWGVGRVRSTVGPVGSRLFTLHSQMAGSRKLGRCYVMTRGKRDDVQVRFLVLSGPIPEGGKWENSVQMLRCLFCYFCDNLC